MKKPTKNAARLLRSADLPLVPACLELKSGTLRSLELTRNPCDVGGSEKCHSKTTTHIDLSKFFEPLLLFAPAGIPRIPILAAFAPKRNLGPTTERLMARLVLAMLLLCQAAAEMEESTTTTTTEPLCEQTGILSDES